MPSTDHSEPPIVRASRVHVRLERAFARVGISPKRGCAGVDPLGEPVIDVGVIGVADGERLADALGEPEAMDIEACAPVGRALRFARRHQARDGSAAVTMPSMLAMTSVRAAPKRPPSSFCQSIEMSFRWSLKLVSYGCPVDARSMPWA